MRGVIQFSMAACMFVGVRGMPEVFRALLEKPGNGKRRK
jgi:hypothetical protein